MGERPGHYASAGGQGDKVVLGSSGIGPVMRSVPDSSAATDPEVVTLLIPANLLQPTGVLFMSGMPIYATDVLQTDTQPK